MNNSYQNSVIAQLIEAIINETSYEGDTHSNIADILLSILEHTEYTKEPRSVIAILLLKLKAKMEGDPFTPYNGAYLGEISAIIISILTETEYIKEPRSRIAELLLELKEELEGYTEITVSGAIASFNTNVAKPLVKCEVAFSASQASGTPTPYNPIPIVGVSSLDVDVNGSTISKALGNTYYEGVLDLASGLLTLTKIKKIIDENTGVVMANVGEIFFVSNFFDIPNDTSGSYSDKLVFNPVYASSTQTAKDRLNQWEYCCNRATGEPYDKRIFIKDSTHTSTQDFNTWLESNPIEIVMDLETPITVQLTPEQITTIIGDNTISSTGDSVTVTYLYRGTPPENLNRIFMLSDEGEIKPEVKEDIKEEKEVEE